MSPRSSQGSILFEMTTVRRGADLSQSLTDWSQSASVCMMP